MFAETLFGAARANIIRRMIERILEIESNHSLHREYANGLTTVASPRIPGFERPWPATWPAISIQVRLCVSADLDLNRHAQRVRRRSRPRRATGPGDAGSTGCHEALERLGCTREAPVTHRRLRSAQVDRLHARTCRHRTPEQRTGWRCWLSFLLEAAARRPALRLRSWSSS